MARHIPGIASSGSTAGETPSIVVSAERCLPITRSAHTPLPVVGALALLLILGGCGGGGGGGGGGGNDSEQDRGETVGEGTDSGDTDGGDSGDDNDGGSGDDDGGGEDGDNGDGDGGTDNGDSTAVTLSDPQSLITGDSEAAPGDTRWSCGDDVFFQFWADGTGRRQDANGSASLVWEIQVAGTLTLNGEFSAALINASLPDPDTLTANEALDGTALNCERVSAPVAPEVPVLIPGYEVVRGETIGGNGSTYTAEAFCSDGNQVIGGGGSQGDFGWYLDDSAPRSDGSGWQAQYSPDISGSPGQGIGEAWAICARLSDSTVLSEPEIIKGDTVSGGGSTYSAVADCASDLIALGGGASQGDFGWYIDDVRPASDGLGWQAQYSPDIAAGASGHGGGIGEAWVVCAALDDPENLLDVEIIRGETLSGGGSVYTAVAECPTGKRVLSGGGSQGDFGWYLDDSRPESDGTGWQAQYAPSIDGSPGGGIGEAWAVCAFVE